MKLSSILQHTVTHRWKAKRQPSVEVLQAGEDFLLKRLQAICFPEEYSALSDMKQISPNSRLSKLDPLLDDKGVMRVGGRLNMSQLPEAEKHTDIIPKDMCHSSS